MFKINKLTDYAIVILTHLAKREKQFYSVNKLVAETHIPQPTVAKLMKNLTKLGFVKAVRGMHGGYQLKCKASQTRISDIISKLEGPIHLTSCNGEGGSLCALSQFCHLGSLWDKINHRIMDVLKQYTLEDFVKYQHDPHFLSPQSPHSKEVYHG